MYRIFAKDRGCCQVVHMDIFEMMHDFADGVRGENGVLDS